MATKNTDTPVVINTDTPVEPSVSYLPTSFIFAGKPRSMGGAVDEAPLVVESDNE